MLSLCFPGLTHPQSLFTLTHSISGDREEDLIEILDDEDEVWWKGRCRGQEGLFPASYVERV